MAENIKFTPEELNKTFVTYRKTFTTLPFKAMSDLLKYTNIATGIRYREIVSEMTGKFEMGNYAKDKKKEDGTSINARSFETFFGNSIDSIDPNRLYQSIWGSNVISGDGLKNVPIVVQVCALIVKSIWENVYLNTFTAKHEDSDTTSTSKWFNGFCTVIDNDIAGTNYSKTVEISEDIGNLQQGEESISESNAVDVIKDFFWSSGEHLRGQQLELFCSDLTYHMYTENYQNLHGSLPYNTSYDKKTLEGAGNVTFVPLSCVPRDFLLLTPKNNIYCLFNQKGSEEGYRVERSLDNHYDVDVICNAFFGTQFESVNPKVFRVWKKKAGE